MPEQLAALILAAGKGVRMKSALPKVLHPILGRPMIRYVIDTVKTVGAQQVTTVVGFGKDTLIAALQGLDLAFVEQAPQLGTGHAVQCFAKQFPQAPEHLMIVCGDTPLLSQETLKVMVDEHLQKRHALTMMTLNMAEPGGYGRILRDGKGRVKAVREAKDCTPEEKLIHEVNMAVYLFHGPSLFERLFKLTNTNRQNEYYLTDLVELFYADGLSISAIVEKDEASTLGINSRQDMAKVSGILQRRILEQHMANGVTIVDPAQTLIEPDVQVGADSLILPGTLLSGKTSIGAESTIGPQAHIHDSTLGKGTKAGFCVIEKTVVGDGAHIKPFTHLSGK